VCTATMLTSVVTIQKGKCGINHNNVIFVSNIMVIFVLEDSFIGTGMHYD
jgi:succinylarginine dihydrolase